MRPCVMETMGGKGRKAAEVHCLGDPSLRDANTSGMEICFGRNQLKSLFFNDIYCILDRVHALFTLQGCRAAPQLLPPGADCTPWQS